jgi:hypothetical protein
LRVKSHSRGEAFNLTLDFNTPIAAKVGKQYILSMFTLINCPIYRCEQAGDSISVRIKDSDNGVFKEVYNVVGRAHDDRWINDQFIYSAVQDKIYVCGFL